MRKTPRHTLLLSLPIIIFLAAFVYSSRIIKTKEAALDKILLCLKEGREEELRSFCSKKAFDKIENISNGSFLEYDGLYKKFGFKSKPSSWEFWKKWSELESSHTHQMWTSYGREQFSFTGGTYVMQIYSPVLNNKDISFSFKDNYGWQLYIVTPVTN